MGCLSIYHPDIYDFLESKSWDEGKLTHFNLSVLVDDKFMEAVENDDVVFLHYPCMNEKGEFIYDESQWKIKKEIRAKELWDLIMTKAYNTGEYGILYYDNINKDNNLHYMENIVTTNPCFTGDMRLLTDKGYKTFKELCDTEPMIYSFDGKISKGKVWCNGEKDTIRLELNTGAIITCTPDHRFMTIDGEECMAKDLMGKEIKQGCFEFTNELMDVHVEVINITDNGRRLVYDFSEPINHWGVVEGLVAHNCGEYVSGIIYDENDEVKDDYFGACNLGSLFLHNFVINPFEKNAEIDWDKLADTIKVAVRLLDNIIDINNYPLPQYENYQKNIRTIGLGITGLADLFTMMNVKYGSKESMDLTDKLMNFVTAMAYYTSCELAKEKGEFNLLNRKEFVESNFIKKHIEYDKETWTVIRDNILKYGIRNGRLISVAPTGTLSLSFGNNCSSGLEPIFSLEYDRKIKIGGQDEENAQIFKMRDFAYELWLNENKEKETYVKDDVFLTSSELGVQEHLNILSTIAKHTDMSCSKTINIPTDYPFEDTKKVYMKCWKEGIKGCTIFRPNEIRQGILLNNKEKNDEGSQEVIELKRGEWEQNKDDIIYIKRRIVSGCGKLALFIAISLSDNRIFDVYYNQSGKGGCQSNIQANAILMSSLLRLGGDISNIEKAFRGLSACPSFVRARTKGIAVSSGDSCPMAILNCLKEVEKDLKKGTLKELMFLSDLEYKNEMVEECVKEENKSLDINKEKNKPINIFTQEELDYIKENGEISFGKNFKKCPVCGESLEVVGSCVQCKCSWSACE